MNSIYMYILFLFCKETSDKISDMFCSRFEKKLLCCFFSSTSDISKKLFYKKGVKYPFKVRFRSFKSLNIKMSYSLVQKKITFQASLCQFIAELWPNYFFPFS